MNIADGIFFKFSLLIVTATARHVSMQPSDDFSSCNFQLEVCLIWHRLLPADQ